jgi:hypothetical protein
MLASEVEKSGKVCSPMLRELNVGRNPITILPDELALLPLKELWIDDCQLTGSLPDCIMRMKDLEILRISNNKITDIPSSIQRLRELKTLCLDGNEIETVPEELSRLCNLETLLLRYVCIGMYCIPVSIALYSQHSSQKQQDPNIARGRSRSGNEQLDAAPPFFQSAGIFAFLFGGMYLPRVSLPPQQPPLIRSSRSSRCPHSSKTPDVQSQ